MRSRREMGNGYNHHDHHNFHHTSTFLPMFCRVSIKEVKLPNWRDGSASSDPSSPRVSCMGHVKGNNKVIGFPTPHKFTTNHHNHHLKYTKLKKLFPSQNLIITTTNKEKKMMMNGRRRAKYMVDEKDSCGVVDKVNIVELDPPLPVIKKVQQRGDEVNLWKRRSGGLTLKALQIQHTYSYA